MSRRLRGQSIGHGHPAYLVLPRNFFHPEFTLHPRFTRQAACPAYAFVDLVALARWSDGGGIRRGECEASARFLGDRWNWSASTANRWLQKWESWALLEREVHRGYKVPQLVRFPLYDRWTQVPPGALRRTNPAEASKTVGTRPDTQYVARSRRKRTDQRTQGPHLDPAARSRDPEVQRTPIGESAPHARARTSSPPQGWHAVPSSARDKENRRLIGEESWDRDDYLPIPDPRVEPDAFERWAVRDVEREESEQLMQERRRTQAELPASSRWQLGATEIPFEQVNKMG